MRAILVHSSDDVAQVTRLRLFQAKESFSSPFKGHKKVIAATIQMYVIRSRHQKNLVTTNDSGSVL